MNWDIILEQISDYGQGAKLTLFLTVTSLAIAFVLAVPLAFLRNSRHRGIRYAILTYSLIFRGTPLLVQLFLVYFGLGQFELIRSSFLWPWLSSPLICALLVFILNATAYSVEIFAGSLCHISACEIEGTRAYGMSRPYKVRRILIPAMLIRALPFYENEVIMMLHATALASTITLLEITGVAGRIASIHFIPLEAYITAAAFYLFITFILKSAFRLVRHRWAGYFDSRMI